MKPLLLLAQVIILLSVQAVQAQSTALFDGSTLTLSLPDIPAGSGQILGDFFIDVPDGATALRVDLQTDSGTRNVDLYIADEPFPVSNDLNVLIANADFYSAGEAGIEFVTLQDSATPPLAGKRWYITVIVLDGAAEQATLSTNITTGPPQQARISVDFDNLLDVADCDTEPWNDATPHTPIGGNNATTLGQARRNAMLETVELIAMELFSPAPIVVRACWENLGGSATAATLASARANFLSINTPGVSNSDTVYVHSVMARAAGTALCNILTGTSCQEQDLFIRFNTDIDSDLALGSTRWYYGSDPAAANGLDFISTAIHEVTHGLGFTSAMSDEGTLLSLDDGTPISDAFTRRLVDNRTGEAIPLEDPSLTDADRLAAATSLTGLQWSGPETSISLTNVFATVDQGLAPMYAPNPYEPGSSVSHVSNAFCELMTPADIPCPNAPFRSLRQAKSMLHELGWAPGSNTPPYLGLMYDRSRDGHGFEFTPVGMNGEGEIVYVLTFYSYESLGSAPEWFQALGTVRDGVFSGAANAVGKGFSRFLYDFDGNAVEADADGGGQVVLSFNDPDGNAACNDGVSRSGPLAVMQWVLGAQVDEWCVEPVVPESTRPAIDYGGLWYAGGADTGWGFSLENIQGNDGSLSLFILLYVYAADGSPVWFLGFAQNVDLSQPVVLDMVQQTGFSRSIVNGSVSAEAAGSFTVTLADPAAGLTGVNRVSVDVAYLGSEGGDWVRDDVAITRLSTAR